MPELETMRYTSAFDLKTDTQKEGRFSGHAAVFNNVDLQGDRIAENAFAHTLKDTGGRWPVLMGHRGDKPIGFSIRGEQDAKGLLVEAELTLGSTEGKNAYASMLHADELGQKLGLSIGYKVRKNGAEWDEQTGIRLLKDLDVLEFSVVAVPANPKARVTRVKSVREAEAMLKDFGLTGDEARQMISVIRGERDANLDETLERDAKEAQLKNAAAFMAELRGHSLLNQMKEVQLCRTQTFRF